MILPAVGLLALAGCEEFADEDQFYQMKVRPEQVRRIDTLELPPKKAEQKTPSEANAAAPAWLELSLEQVRAMTLANNLDLKVQLVEPSIAAAQVSEEEAKFESAFFSDLSLSKTNQPAASDVNIIGSNVDRTSMDLGVQVPLRTGGTVTFDLAEQRTETNFLRTTFNPYFTTRASLSVSQELLRGAGKRANTHSIRITEYQRQITDAQTKLEVIRVLADADRTYWRLYAARRELEVRKQEYDSAQAQLEQTKRMVASGEKPQVEILRSQAGAAERLEAIIKAENDLRDRERELKQILNQAGLRMDTPTTVVPMTEPDPVRYELDRPRLVAAAIENRMEMLELQLQIAQDISTVDFYKNQALPLVTLNYTYNISGLGQVSSDAYDMLYDKHFEDHILGLRLLVPLGNKAAKSRLRQAFYRQRQRLSSADNRRTLIEMDVLGAIDQMEANWQSILASRQNAILAGRLYEAEKRQYELGLRTSTDVLDQQAKFANAQSAEILALAEYQIAQVDLAYATGTLLGAAKIRFEPIVPKARLSRSR